MAYIQIQFSGVSEETREILIALLSELEYEGFEEEIKSLKAFVSKPVFDEAALQAIAKQLTIDYTLTEIPDANWNALWESNFKPIIIGNWALRAEFHEPVFDAAHEIIITPKMSFGTGHHATTFMMVQQMQDIDFKNKNVLDFGTGTGVLAILAHKLGAAPVVAIDNDEWSIENAKENFSKNSIDDIELKLAGNADTNQNFQIILANIIRNVIMDNFIFFDRHLAANGILLLSGLLQSDEEAILSLAAKYNMMLQKKLQRENWICLQLTRQ